MGEHSSLQDARDMRERLELGQQLRVLQQELHSLTPALTAGQRAGSNWSGQVPQGVVRDGRMDERVDGRVDGRVDRRVDERVDGKVELRLALLGKRW